MQGIERLEQQFILPSAVTAPIEFPAVVAALLAAQAASATAAAQIHHDVARHVAHSSEQALTILMQARPGWRAAAGALQGSFHPHVATLVGR